MKKAQPIWYPTQCPRCAVKFRGVTGGCVDPKCIRGTRFVAGIRAKGCDATDVRDAAHEACHAVEWGLRGKWTRDGITRKNPFKGRLQAASGIRDEITARAVEALVCEKLEVAYDTDKWVLMMVMETLKFDGIALPSHEWAKDAILVRKLTTHALDLADKLIDMFAPIE